MNLCGFRHWAAATSSADADSGDLFADIYHDERIGSHHLLAFHLATESVNQLAEIQAEAQARAATLAQAMKQVGLEPTPNGTQGQAQTATNALSAAGIMALNCAPGMLQLSTLGEGVLTTTSELAGYIAGALWRGASTLASLAVASPADAVITAIVGGFWPAEAGKDSDKVPGRDMPVLLGVQASVMAGGTVSIQPRMKTVNLPVRGVLAYEEDHLGIQLVKTGGLVSSEVQVLTAVRDTATGLDRITVPAVQGIPARTILINPVLTGQGIPSNTGNTAPAPVTPTHTGDTFRQAGSIVTTTLPIHDDFGLQDFIYGQPDAPGIGVEPIYVMLNRPLDSRRFTGKQLDKKFKHATDFGITDTKKNNGTLTQYRDAIESHLRNIDTIEKSTYRREKDSRVLFNPKMNNVVVLDKQGNFISEWHITPNTSQYDGYINTGVL